MLPAVRFYRGEKFVVTFLVVGLSLIVLLAVIIFVPSAVIIIKTNSEPVTMNIEILFDSSLTKIPPTIVAVPAKIVARKEFNTQSGSESKERFAYDGRLEVKIRDEDYVILYKLDDLMAVVKRELTKLLRSDRELLADDQPKIIIKETKAGDDLRSLQAVIRAEAVAVPLYPYTKWQQQAKYSPKRLLTLIKSTDGVRETVLLIRPSFWPLLPVLQDHIRFDLDIQ
ncbi:hypothetical protein A3H10_04025 [Candidatus Uhrbacteria bacterium RIFCSPLOWO2_12_FULL_46_10]|uniref:Uncharacterized protein n=1 Tax=Candidatus Uhrbacteria bacterium RIFCSPLOWO2_01_FULL_47_25 TaxID=1802402 RepID=A0A1F7UY38_9BACT|nr:MAG: hypothetical protein UX68_C0004G0033 [Parcubacteria group bacterium GW2011_GWA2_46_9]OGL61371.1 MAG: hypothetical protein A2752_01640 [Candidatus Uhrbacteria bacterium RIFCSPHIGHO2_01_FULL_46_23]OGL70649.1 MAG: hypothetical protein A3D60_04265 [Candidatus Uhrbacteria bacterium RIFCSPHIGHO2_02_FULL_47_29]OGL76415.1 MAG: hypothetical protein A3E96_02285 [Candidatus Uhrbacteria bacterium RIFCSPHIGHO2_12_FULL_46_13]OGL83156.1 MAG: hypothetical protein A2936_01485 [Candidatus Uhrbacteria bac